MNHEVIMYYHALIYQQITKNLMILFKNQYHCIIQGLLLDVSDLLPTNLEIHWGLGETPQWIGRWTLQCPDGFRLGENLKDLPEVILIMPNLWDNNVKKTFSRHDVERFSFCSFLFEGSGVALPLTWSLVWLHEKDLVDLFNIHNGRSFRLQVPSGWWKLALVCNSLSSRAFPTIRPSNAKTEVMQGALGTWSLAFLGHGCFFDVESPKKNKHFTFISTAFLVVMCIQPHLMICTCSAGGSLDLRMVTLKVIPVQRRPRIFWSILG